MAEKLIIDSATAHLDWKVQNELSRCLLCKDAPCSAACGAHGDPARRIRALRFKNLYGAIEGLEAEGCLECEGLCESSCVLAASGNGVNIKKILNAAAEIRKNAVSVDAGVAGTAGESTVAGVNGSAGAAGSAGAPDLSLDICGVKLENPYLLSSSVVASNYEMCAKALRMGWAGVCFKTICTFDQHEASPRFSVQRSRSESFYGFKNIEQLSDHAVEENLEIFRRLKAEFPEKVIISSIMGQNEEEWEELARKSQEAGADVIECNFSCSNMEDGGLGVTIGQSEELIEKFTRAARRGTRLPLLAKMTPNITDMVPMARAAKRGGADGIAAINTIKSITGINIDSLVPEPTVHGRSAEGGYSGNAVKPIALRFISDLAGDPELAGMHISGMGGIENWRDGLEFILLGAGSLQITTAVMQYGYRIIDDLLGGLEGYLRERNIGSVRELVGVSNENLVSLDEIERDTILFPRFREDQCVGCGRCEISCYDGGHQAIVFDREVRRPKLIGSRCVGCQLCRLVCPAEAIGVARRRVYREPRHK